MTLCTVAVGAMLRTPPRPEKLCCSTSSAMGVCAVALCTIPCAPVIAPAQQQLRMRLLTEHHHCLTATRGTHSTTLHVTGTP